MKNPSDMNRALEGERIHQAIRDFVQTGKINSRFAAPVGAASRFMDGHGLTNREAEVSFSMQTSLGAMNGRIDLMARNKHGEAVVVDWKTVRNDRDLPNTDGDGCLVLDDAQLTSYVEWAYRQGHTKVSGYRVTIATSGQYEVQWDFHDRTSNYQAFARIERNLAKGQLLDDVELMALAEVRQNCLDVDNLRAGEGNTWMPRVVEPARLRELVANRSAWL